MILIFLFLFVVLGFGLVLFETFLIAGMSYVITRIIAAILSVTVGTEYKLRRNTYQKDKKRWEIPERDFNNRVLIHNLSDTNKLSSGSDDLSDYGYFEPTDISETLRKKAVKTDEYYV